MKKKLVSMMLVAAMAAVTLAGCGSSASTADSAADTTETTEAADAADTTEAAETTEADDTAAAGAAETFLIGGIGPLTGGAASYGISVKQGAEVAIAEINSAGGVTAGDTTYQLALAFEDDEASEEKSPQAYNTLMDQGINALMGTVTSGACLAITDLTYEDNILQITPSGSAQDCTNNPNAFRICFTDPLQGETMAD
ncbi:MAG TPA: ABC transporter substrate-binding protein, partial [Lachnospiraceae bacterium]|nr:ABC transporter substrate-binding protein [Lachnospiraceae bacterium]